jgi:predicted nucleic acid-binding protein
LAIRWGTFLLEETSFELVYTHPKILYEAWNIYKKEGSTKKPLSFTDCSLIAMCKEYNISKIITFDNHLGSYIK